MQYSKLTITVIFLFFLSVVSACSATAKPATEQASTADFRIIVTQHFGQEILLDQTQNLADRTNALDALKQIAQVETAYGGGFVNSINGIHSKYTGHGSTPEDWFFYINGMESNTGALDYILHPGDTEQWDFHNWSFHQFVPAISGDFPEPFEHGYGGKTCPTIIVYTDGFQGVASNLKQKLIVSGVKATSQSLTELTEKEKESSNLVLLGTQDNPLISELNQKWERLGFFAYFSKSSLITLNNSGQVSTKYGADSGVIQATQNPWNPDGIGSDENVVWLISGTDAAGTKAAANVLLNQVDELKGTFAAIITSGKIVKLPQ